LQPVYSPLNTSLSIQNVQEKNTTNVDIHKQPGRQSIYVTDDKENTYRPYKNTFFNYKQINENHICTSLSCKKYVIIIQYLVILHVFSTMEDLYPELF